MSQQLEDMSNSLFNNQVPGLWAKAVNFKFRTFMKLN